MWFNNALIFQCRDLSTTNLEQELEAHRLKPCPGHARLNYGWLESINELLLHSAQNFHFFTMGKNEKLLPSSVINQELAERIAQLELNQDRKVKRSEKAQMKEEIEFELLPKAFSITKKMHALYDPASQRLIINSSSLNQANQLLALLRKTLDQIQLEPLNIDADLSQYFTQWVSNPNLLPKHFELAPNCLLYSPQDENKKVNCKGYEFPADEIAQLIKQGLLVNEINLIWNERIQFTLNSDFTLKRIKCIEYLLDELHEIDKSDDLLEQQDANLCLLGSELKQLTDSLLELFTQTNETTQEKAISQEPVHA